MRAGERRVVDRMRTHKRYSMQLDNPLFDLDLMLVMRMGSGSNMIKCGLYTTWPFSHLEVRWG